MTIFKLPGSSIVSNTITTNQLQTTVVNQISAGGGPRVSSLIYPGDDTAANTVGGQTVYVTGSGFAANANVYINGNAVPSISFISASNLAITTPALSAATYPVYVINPETGATAIHIPGLRVSGDPTWVTAAGSLSASQDEASAWSYTVSANSDSAVTYALAGGSSLPTGISLAANGLISGTLSSPPGTDTTYNFTVVATDAENQNASRAFSVTVTASDGVLFANNVLLIHADGTNNKNNHAFLDSSNNNFTITRAGNATQGSFSPFSQTGWSNYFDGSGDYLTASDNVAFQMGAGDFTIEFWANLSAVNSTQRRAYSYQASGSNAVLWVGVSTTNKFAVELRGTGGTGANALYRLDGTTTPVVGLWYHVAAVRSGTTIYLFVNGVLDATATDKSQNIGSGGTLSIGAFHGTPTDFWDGYISNLRVIKGTALYTSTFTPPTASLTAVSNTSLLTCQSNRFVDNSTNAFTLTRNGDVSVQAFSPFAPTAAYSTANVGGSGYFDGNGDTLTISGNTALDLTGDFTFEFWGYSIGDTSYLSQGSQIGSGEMTFTQYASTGTVVFQLAIDSWAGVSISSASGKFTKNEWNHFAATRSGNTFRLFVNGVVVASTTNSGSLTNTGRALQIGYYTENSGTYYTSGYYSGIRVIKGTALYTGAFTPPTAPPTNVANTQFLCNFTNAGIFDQTAKNVLETVGDAKVSTAQYKYGSGSIVLDGTGDYLVTNPTTDLNNFRTQDWTIEFWVKSTQTTRADIFGWNYNFSSAGWAGILANVSTSGQLEWYENTTSRISASSTGWNNGSWNHIAVTRSGNSVKMFLNGTQIGSTYTTSFSYGASSSGFIIGTIPGGGGALNGYIDDFRITKGYARYTTNFTAPTSAFKDK